MMHRRMARSDRPSGRGTFDRPGRAVLWTSLIAAILLVSSVALEPSVGSPERSTHTIKLPADSSPQGARPVRIRFFTDRYDWMGPVIVVLSSWYFAAQVLVAWVFRPQYSFVSNAISDLGNTACPPPHSGICLPLHAWMNVSLVILGLAMIVGSMLIFSEFSFSEDRRERAAAHAGFWCMALGGAGAALVGIVPENVNTAHLHTVGTAMAIGFGQLAILILGLVLRQIPDWLLGRHPGASNGQSRDRRAALAAGPHSLVPGVVSELRGAQALSGRRRLVLRSEVEVASRLQCGS